MDRWLERTGDFDDFVPANVLWEAMLHAAGLTPDAQIVWGHRRNQALDVVRRQLGLSKQHARYYHLPQRIAGMPPGVVLGSYERLRLTEYAHIALSAPILVRPKARKRVAALSASR